MLPEFEALRLNLGTSDVATQRLIEADTWARIEGDAPRSGPCVWGLDLGTSAAQSAVAAYWPDTGALDVLAAFPERPALAERGLRDGVGSLYRDMERRGELVTLGGNAVDLGALISAALARFGRPVALTADRWREAELRDALAKAGAPAAALTLRGQGFRDGGEDVRDFRRACLEGRCVPVVSLLLRNAMGEARTVTDPAGNAQAGQEFRGRAPRAGSRRCGGGDDPRGGEWLPGRRQAEAAAAPSRARRLSRAHAYIGGRRWAITRRLVFDRDGYRCRACGRPGAARMRSRDPVAPGRRPVGALEPASACAGPVTSRRRPTENRTRSPRRLTRRPGVAAARAMRSA